jgi:hypothetical protein
MATLKNPSIYDDRSTIGSADELDEYGVWVKVEPEELSDTDADNFPDFEADFAPELSLDKTIEDDAAFEDFVNFGDGEEDNFDDIEALRQDIAPPLPAEAADYAAVEPAMEPLAEPAMGKPVAEPAAQPVAASASAAETAPMDLSTQLLMKIADELSSIKEELSTLKGELAVIRSEKPRHSAAGTEEEEATGFFDEEGDDKIALTGDELNNIIHTADFTEETGFDAGDSLSGDFAEEDILAEEAAPSLSGGGAVIYDGLGRPLRTTSPEGGSDEDSSLAAPAAADPVVADSSDGGATIYDGLGRPLNRKTAETDDTIGPSFELEDSDDLKALRENGVEPMTPPPEDTSYLEEDPLAEENLDLEGNLDLEESLDLSDAVIEEPDLSEGIKDTPLEEPSLDSLSLIDLETMEGGSNTPVAGDEEPAGEKPFVEDITFEDLLDPESPAEGIADIENLDEGETIDLSIFENDFPVKNADALDEPDGVADANSGDFSFEVVDEDSELPVQQNIQDNVITEDSFEPISLDDDGEIEEALVDDDLEQSLPEGMKIELEDLPPLELSSPDEEDDENFDLPGSADSADAGDQAISREEVPSTIRMELRDVLIYMDKLLESLPEEKINEFAQSEHYNTYKKLFEELGIHQ